MARLPLLALLPLALLPLALGLPACGAPADEVLYEADFSAGDAHGWRPTSNLGDFDLSSGYLRTRATGGDANMSVSGLNVAADRVSHLWFRMRSNRSGATQVYFATSVSPDPAAHVVPVAQCSGDGQWHEYIVQLAGIEGFSGTLSMLRLDPVNGGGEDATIDLEWVRLIRRAPRLVCARLSADRALLEPGQTATLTMELLNTGGPPTEPIVAEVGPVAQVAVRQPRVTIERTKLSSPQQITWDLSAQRVGLAELEVVVSLGEETVLRATIALPVIDWASLPAPGEAGVQHELFNDRVSLLLLEGGRPSTAAAGLLRVKKEDAWQAAAVLSPLIQLACRTEELERFEHILPGYSESGGDFLTLAQTTPQAEWSLRFGLAGDRLTCALRAETREGFGLRRLSGPVLRVGVGAGGSEKTAAVFPGIEFLEGGQRSSDVEVVGDTVGYRPSPAELQVTVPAPAVLEDGVLCALLWDPLQPWHREQGGLVAAEFASPNFLDGQDNHLLSCFVPGAPWRRPNEPVAGEACEIAAGEALSFAATVLARVGGDIVDAVPEWYAVYGRPEPPAPPHTPREALDLCIQGWAQTLWFPEQRGFNNHWHIGQEPYWDPRLAVNILQHGLKSGERRWIEAIGIRPEATILELTGSMFESYKAPAPPASLATQSDNGLWPYEPPEDMAEKVKDWTGGKHDNLGEPGSFNVGVAANAAISLLSHAARWGDGAAEAAGLRALDAMEQYRVPAGCQGWEVHIQIPDIYAAARIMDCYRLGYELTGEQRYLDRARYWAYTGLPFLYAYEVPGTGPGANVSIPWPEPRVSKSDLVFQDPDAHRPTPWGSIPVFGTSFYRVTWLGNLVQWCGLCWASSVYALLAHGDEELLRAAADGVVISGIHQTYDKEPYVGLLPDTWHLSSNTAHPALIGPVRLETPLRQMIDEPEYGGLHTVVARGADARAHITSRSVPSEASLQPRSLTWTQRFPVGQVCETQVVLGREPARVRVDGRDLPRVPDILQVDDGWQVLADGTVALRLTHAQERCNLATEW